ncbi:hypothetical protein ZOSMA_141G00310 [Zostera marina]|uniref:Uncharacterized protein n=1 Tax=Zostera marina TaxID=29655 RepID=A0A0K9PXI1_ZOSMR|nr:hypothetical protein ZOSMA_141G00310 [Zostera marina]
MMGLNKTTLRLRYLTNWLITSLFQLRIPDPTGKENDHIPLVYIYGPKIKYERGSFLALNIKRPTIAELCGDNPGNSSELSGKEWYSSVEILKYKGHDILYIACNGRCDLLKRSDIKDMST